MATSRLLLAILLIPSVALGAPAWTIDQSGDNSPLSNLGAPDCTNAASTQLYTFTHDDNYLYVGDYNNIFKYSQGGSWTNIGWPDGHSWRVIDCKQVPSYATDKIICSLFDATDSTGDLYEYDGSSWTLIESDFLGVGGWMWASGIVPIDITCGGGDYDFLIGYRNNAKTVSEIHAYDISGTANYNLGQLCTQGTAHCQHYIGTMVGAKAFYYTACRDHANENSSFNVDASCNVAGQNTDSNGIPIQSSGDHGGGYQLIPINVNSAAKGRIHYDNGGTHNYITNTENECLTGGGVSWDGNGFTGFYHVRAEASDGSTTMAKVYEYQAGDPDTGDLLKDLGADYSETGRPVLVTEGPDGALYVVMYTGSDNTVYRFGEEVSSGAAPVGPVKMIVQ